MIGQPENILSVVAVFYLKVNKCILRYLRQQRKRNIPHGVSREKITFTSKSFASAGGFASGNVNRITFLGTSNARKCRN
ncbi:MAG: hypothetical protein NWF03_07520 [Candidatus Bathyarchaeota archaeon]|nr:hypothetical protein [Candidatus Bathyarchaeota archaeon]